MDKTINISVQHHRRITFSFTNFLILTRLNRLVNRWHKESPRPPTPESKSGHTPMARTDYDLKKLATKREAQRLRLCLECENWLPPKFTSCQWHKKKIHLVKR